MSLIEKYHNGGKVEVWREVRKIPSPELIDKSNEVNLICDAACGIMLKNLNHAISVLRAFNYQFVSPGAFGTDKPKPHKPITPPDTQTRKFLNWFEQQYGPIGPLGRAFAQIIGDVNLNGICPTWSDTFLQVDPFMMAIENKDFGKRYEKYYKEEYETYAEYDDLDDFGIPISSDDFHKANISGGPEYRLLIPTKGAIPRLKIKSKQVDMVDYLNSNIDSGFFPGLNSLKSKVNMKIIEEIKSGLTNI